MKRPPGPIDSVDSLRRRMPTIVAAINEDPALATRAAANPILALEELGITLTDDFRPEAEARARFPEDEASEFLQLRARVVEHVGPRVDLGSTDDLVRALARLDVKVPRKAILAARQRDEPSTSASAGLEPIAEADAAATKARPSSRARAKGPAGPFSLPSIPPPTPSPADSRILLPVLRELGSRHPVMKPLVAYLELDSSRPRLASAGVYERLRERPPDPDGPEVAVRFTLQRGRGERGEG